MDKPSIRTYPSIPNVPDAKNPGFKTPEKVEVPQKPTAPKPKMWIIYMDKVKTIAVDAATGKSQIGQLIYGVADMIPGSSVFDLVKKVAKNALSVGVKRAIQNQLPKIQWTRLILQVLQLSFFIYLFMSGNMTIEEVLEFVKSILIG